MLKNLFWLIPAIFLIVLSGCETNIDSDDDEEDFEAPAAPRGVYSVTGDGEVIVRWYPNGESDLYKYGVWRSRNNQDFELLDEVSDRTTRYVDRDVINGETYYYAVTAIDFEGNESELSPETVSDTPRPEGYGVTLRDYNLWPDISGFDFSRPNQGVLPWDDPKTDIYFGFDEEVGISYMYSDNETEMQDMGYHETMSEIDESPVRGFTTLYVELLEGHVYVFYTPDRHYAMIRVLTVTADTVTFDWAYQIDRDNPELAPVLLKSEASRLQDGTLEK